MGCILAIESSCDETAAAVVDERLRVRASVVASQHDLHAEYGGVVPEIASRAHLERVLPVIRKALDDARISIAEIEGVAAGVRPGLIGSLLVGAAAAKGLAWARGLPFYGVDHVVAHLFAGLAAREGEPAPEARVPALGLVVSGGHTSLFRISGPREVELLGRTIDDAVGEALDKAATMLGLPHPGGPSLEKLAAGGDPDALRFALPRLPSALDFSLSGMKTKLLYEVRGVPEGRGASARFPRSLDDVSPERRRDLAASVQHGVFAQVIDRLSRAAELLSPQTLLVGGGVVANRSLRAMLEDWTRARDIALVLPRPEHCVDNAAMIALHAQLRRRVGDLGDDLSEPVEAVSTLARGLRGKGVRA